MTRKKDESEKRIGEFAVEREYTVRRVKHGFILYYADNGSPFARLKRVEGGFELQHWWRRRWKTIVRNRPNILSLEEALDVIAHNRACVF